MDCNKCGDHPKTVDQVLACKTCKDDGTANEIPKDMLPEALLTQAVERKPGLGNRFTQEKASAPTAPAPAKPARKAKAQKKKPSKPAKAKPKAKKRRR